MSAKHALLGLLLERPGYPYQLADRLQELLGPTWKINSGQLSQTIKSMQEEDLIERVGSEPDAKDQRRQIYAITSTGELEYEGWYRRITKPGRISRRPLLLKIALAGGPGHMDDALEEIGVYERDCVEVVTNISRVRDAEPPAHWSWVDRVIFRLSLNADLAQAEAELRWAREARAEVSLLAREGVSSTRGTADRRLRRVRDDVFGRMASGDLRLACGGGER